MEALGILMLIGGVILFILAILWMILPFTVGKILEEIKKTNKEFFELRLLLERNTAALRSLQQQKPSADEGGSMTSKGMIMTVILTAFIAVGFIVFANSVDLFGWQAQKEAEYIERQERSARSFYKMGLDYEVDKNYSMAIVTYESIIEIYPRTKVSEDAERRLKQVRETQELFKKLDDLRNSNN